MWKRKAVAALVLAGGMMLTQTVGAQAAPAQHPLNGTDPTETGCNVGAYVVKSWDMLNPVYNEVQGKAQLVYSPKCGTNWVNVYGFTTGYTYTVFMHAKAEGSWFFDTTVDAGDSAATLQTYAPGSTCVEVSWHIKNSTSLFREAWGTSTIC
ncbi:DUF2690 domain-containing protein [Arthrobacter sp. TWP1-1]|uniref:DUF2690 domain-containing protein n=1 Tax=Arthrobacter sp. TWP1-1 TaxID=2804568 RepID=UPI003CEA231A